MRIAFCCFIVVFAGMAQAVHAQVFRCTGKHGEVIYSDRRCDHGGGAQIERQKSWQEIARERDEAADAEARKQDRRMAEQEREYQEALGRQLREPSAMRQEALQVSPGEQSYEQRLHERYANVRSILDKTGKPRPERATVPDDDDAAPLGPKGIKHCNNGYCYGYGGQKFKSIGQGYMRSQDGQTTCRLDHGQYYCR